MNKKTINKAKRATKLLAKRTGTLPLIIMALFVVTGLIVGYFASAYITKSEYFELNGDSTITLNVGDTYEELGASANVLFRDVTEKITISGSVDTTTAGEYYIIYKLDEIRYKDYALIRTIIVQESD